MAIGRYDLLLGSEALEDSSAPVFDPMLKYLEGEALHDKPLLYSLYHAMLRDFYQPHTLGTLFSLVYPGEKYNAYSSPTRIVQLIRSLNIWFLKNKISLRVQFKKDEFKLLGTHPI